MKIAELQIYDCYLFLWNVIYKFFHSILCFRCNPYIVITISPFDD